MHSQHQIFITNFLIYSNHNQEWKKTSNLPIQFNSIQLLIIFLHGIIARIIQWYHCIHVYHLMSLFVTIVSIGFVLLPVEPVTHRSEVMLNPFKILKMKFRRFWCWWQAKNPIEKWIEIRGLFRVICELIGIRIFSDMKNYWYTASSAVCFLLYLLLNFYTIQYYLFRREFVRVIECIYLIGPIIGVC